MEREGLDGLVLLKSGNVRYATGARILHSDGSRESLLPAAAILGPATIPSLLTPDREGIGSGVPVERVADSFYVDDVAGAERFTALVRDCLPDARRIAIDRLSVPFQSALRRELPRTEIVDADTVLSAARMVKLPAEITLLRRAQELNEAAIHAVLDRLRPGVREIDLTAAFHHRLGELGVTAVHVESVWCALPRKRSEAPWTPRGSFPYRELTSERALEAGDLVAMDTGILHEGYMSDFGRTWVCGAYNRPTDAELRIFERWRAVLDRLLSACRPGASALDLRRAALDGWSGPEPPWPLPLYVAHSIGLGGVEPPFVGTDLGEALEEQWLLRPGMVIVLEPYVWEEGVGGYRAEETVLITESGCERFTDFPYGAFVP
jgi:Xaa-Pro aminopeptidase